jgi:hypothetical protein
VLTSNTLPLRHHRVGNLSISIEPEFLAPTGPSGLEGRAIRGLIIEQHLACLREGLIPLAERCGRVMLEALYSLEVLCAAPSQSVERSQAAQISVVFEPRVFVIEQRSGGNPPSDKLTIRFAARHLSACIEQFSAFETGINSFAVRDTDTLKNRRRLVISRLWRESLLDRAKKLRFIESIGAGADQFLRQELVRRDIRLARSPPHTCGNKGPYRRDKLRSL